MRGFSGSAATVDVMFSESTLNRIVDTVMRRMSAEAIREVAWEVVPELSESIIRRTMEEQNKSPKSHGAWQSDFTTIDCLD